MTQMGFILTFGLLVCQQNVVNMTANVGDPGKAINGSGSLLLSPGSSSHPGKGKRLSCPKSSIFPSLFREFWGKCSLSRPGTAWLLRDRLSSQQAQGMLTGQVGGFSVLGSMKVTKRPVGVFTAMPFP